MQLEYGSRVVGLQTSSRRSGSLHAVARVVTLGLWEPRPGVGYRSQLFALVTSGDSGMPCNLGLSVQRSNAFFCRVCSLDIFESLVWSKVPSCYWLTEARRDSLIGSGKFSSEIKFSFIISHVTWVFIKQWLKHLLCHYYDEK